MLDYCIIAVFEIETTALKSKLDSQDFDRTLEMQTQILATRSNFQNPHGILEVQIQTESSGQELHDVEGRPWFNWCGVRSSSQQSVLHKLCAF